MSFAPLPLSPRPAARHHGILPLRGLSYHRDWGEHALQRTWKTASVLCVVLALLNAFVVKWSAALFIAAGLWAHLKSDPTLGSRLVAHPLLGAPWRWWVQRGRRLPVQSPDTTPQM